MKATHAAVRQLTAMEALHERMTALEAKLGRVLQLLAEQATTAQPAPAADTEAGVKRGNK